MMGIKERGYEAKLDTAFSFFKSVFFSVNLCPTFSGWQFKIPSPDLAHWQPYPDALPVKAAWAQAQAYWPPDVVEVGENEYRLFFNAEVAG